MNDQFTGPLAWEDHLSAFEAVTPAIEAIAVTDYYVTETYEQVLEYQSAGRLPLAKLIFPNVELRLDVAAKKGFVCSPSVPIWWEEVTGMGEFDCLRRLLP